MDPTSVSDGERVTLRCRTKCTCNILIYTNLHHLLVSYMIYQLLFILSSSTPDGPKNTLVSVSPSGEIVEDSSVTLTCSSDANPPVDKYTWYKKNVASLTGSEKTYNFTTISSEDSGEYYCEAENKYGRLNSSSVSVDVQGSHLNSYFNYNPSGEIVEGSSVTLTCSSDANPPVDKYTWYFQNKTFLNGFGQIHIRECTGESVTIRLFVLLCGTFLLIMLSVLSSHQGNSSPVYENVSSMAMTTTAAQTAATVGQDDVHYASVHFSRLKNQEVPLYSTVQLHQPQKQDEDVQYDAVKFNLPSAANQ
uniref:Ig-like domain-containing protein n=1 Tax=Salmo trutta TaxID=8032 RepID=A0A674CMS8_SALTR